EQDGVEDGDRPGLRGGAAEVLHQMVEAKVVDIVPEHGDGSACDHDDNAVAAFQMEGKGGKRRGEKNADKLEGNGVTDTVGGGPHGNAPCFPGRPGDATHYGGGRPRLSGP